MEAVHHELLFQACLTCVTNLTWIYTLTSVGPECIPNIQAFSGTLHDHAVIKQECKELRYDLIPLPNITQEEFEEWFNVSITTSTTPLPTTSLPLSELQKCHKCVERGRHFAMLTTGHTMCVLDRSSFPEDLVLARASYPKRCDRVKWNSLMETTTTTSTIDALATTEDPISTGPQARTTYAGVTIGVVGATIFGFLMMGLGYFSYIRKCREVPEDEESFGRSESVTTNNWVFNYNRGQGEDEVDAVEMTPM